MKLLTTGILTLALLLTQNAARAEEVMTISNGTTLKAAPARSAATAWRVNGGFPLLVLDKRGDWLKVSSSRLPDDAGSLWVRTDQVVALDEGGEPMRALQTPDTLDEEVIAFQISLQGTPRMKFNLECRVIRDGRVRVEHHFNRLPQTYEIDGDALSCVSFKKQHSGELAIELVAIYPSRERVIGTASSRDYPTSIFARSEGPWGPAAVVPARRHRLVLE